MPFINVKMLEGRTHDQKKELVKAITDAMVTICGAKTARCSSSRTSPATTGPETGDSSPNPESRHPWSRHAPNCRSSLNFTRFWIHDASSHSRSCLSFKALPPIHASSLHASHTEPLSPSSV